jgi:alpha-L-fucosidase
MTTRREFLTASAAALAARRSLLHAARIPAVLERPRPTPSQLEWQRDELAMFVHFGVNTFTDREWGDGTEDPAIFNPSALDARQWARTARTAGFKAMILTAKHHDGFCLWPTRTTKHSVASSPFRNGHGDAVREFVDACRAEGLKPGLYLSPWDRNAPVYGDSARYNDMYCDQLAELLTNYGSITEVWFDGARGDGPVAGKQVYDWPRFWGVVRKLQPGAVIFSDAGPDVRWIGTESGVAAPINWSTVEPSVVTVPGMAGSAVTKMLREGDPNGTVWRPGETDVSIRPGWFYHPADDEKVKSINRLMMLYGTSVGLNSKLLLNVPPTRAGLLHETDVANLGGFRQRLDAMHASDVVPASKVSWERGPDAHIATIVLPNPAVIKAVSLQEPIENGQVVNYFRIEGRPEPSGLLGPGREWITWDVGVTVGYRRHSNINSENHPLNQLRVTIRAIDNATPPVAIRAYTAV